MHPGEQSLLLHVETTLKSYLMTAADLNCPLNVADTIAFANQLLKGSKIAAKIIRRKKERGMYNKDSPLVGHKWYMLFQGRNEDVRATVGANLEQNRNDHMTHATFSMMFDQIEKALCLSGNITTSVMLFLVIVLFPP